MTSESRVFSNYPTLGGRRSSVDSSAPSILPPWVPIPSTPSTLLSIQIQVVKYWKDTNKQKNGAGIGPLKQSNLVTSSIGLCRQHGRSQSRERWRHHERLWRAGTNAIKHFCSNWQLLKLEQFCTIWTYSTYAAWQDWEIYWILATFWSLWPELICPNLLHSWAIFVKVSKYLICQVKSFLDNFYRHLATFYWSH